MKIIFMGTPDFAVPSLKELIKNHEVSAVFTQPDRPKGRGKKLAFSAVKEVAVAENIPVFQPEKLKNERSFIDEMKKIQPDYIIVVAYGQILSKEILDIPKYACINLHASLLPKYRGAAPLNWAVIKGEKKSGNTTMLMSEGLDEGDMLLKNEVDITENMTAGELHNILMEKGAGLLLETIEKYSNNLIVPEKQNNEDSNYASMLNKEIAKINWDNKVVDIHNLVRGLNPWPITFSNYKNEVMKIYETSYEIKSHNYKLGEIADVTKNEIKVAARDGFLSVKKIQFPGKKPVEVSEYLKGNSIEIGEILK